ncbi:transmembrane protein 169-like [Ostrea edulis]|uniref:transmembrane protein 169-like n=1 Tax=Ostrea edulis TaxID=37623 RepID=UPI0024AF0C9A|nr:transmembrane protein 169-like [Ostrea edulis]XP_048729439.2 transmembrane protein 169-like [Ostrea edulis]
MASACSIDEENQDGLDNEHITVNDSAEKDPTLVGNTDSDKNSKVQIYTHNALQPKPPVVRFSSAKGDNTEQVEVIEYTDTEVMDSGSSGGSRCCGATDGPHVTLMSVVLLPIAFLSSLAVVFYYGAWTWYNLYIHYSEERTICHKVLVCPVLIITFPLTVGLSSLGVALFAAFVQISWSFYRWKTEFLDFEKGFYGWLCYKLGLPMCSPYDVLEYTDVSELEPIRT